jgi:hypothetical protein
MIALSGPSKFASRSMVDYQVICLNRSNWKSVEIIRSRVDYQEGRYGRILSRNRGTVDLQRIGRPRRRRRWRRTIGGGWCHGFPARPRGEVNSSMRPSISCDSSRVCGSVERQLVSNRTPPTALQVAFRGLVGARRYRGSWLHGPA